MINASDINRIVNYLLQHNEIKEVIISGGDPFLLPDYRLERLIKRLGRVPNLNLIRIASRALCFHPGRINSGLIRVLRNSKKQVWFISHFNHPAELGPEVRTAAKKLIAAGIPVLSQTVLLKGINDRVEILLALFRELAGLGIKPYQLFQCDPAPGAAHFATELSDSLKLVENFGKVSGILLPRFALELPGYGKLSPGPGWKIARQTGSYRLVSPEGRSFRYPAAKK
jgi:lysine 2,3-aminomutase